MVNSQVVAETAQAFKLDLNVDKIPAPIPVIEVGVKSVKNAIAANAGLSNATSATVYTCPSNQDFYLTSCILNMIKDATSTSLYVTLRVYINGQSTTLIYIPCFTLTAQTMSCNLIFPHPLKLDRGSQINVLSDTNVANIKAYGSISGFIDEVT